MVAAHEAGVLHQPQRTRADVARVLGFVDVGAEHAVGAVVFQLIGNIHHIVGQGAHARLGRRARQQAA